MWRYAVAWIQMWFIILSRSITFGGKKICGTESNIHQLRWKTKKPKRQIGHKAQAVDLDELKHPGCDQVF